MTHVKKFLDHHRLQALDIPILVESPISSLFVAQQIFKNAFSTTPLLNPSDGFFRCALENLSDRIFELCDGALVCLAAGAPAGAEPLARAAIEGAVNALYICDNNHKERLFGYFFRYLNEHKQKLEKWSDHKANQTNDIDVLKMIERREEARSGMEWLVNRWREGLSLPDARTLLSRWPSKFFDRCEQLGLKETYYTSYHRLSASSHMNAEETINYLISYISSAESISMSAVEQLGVESVHYSSLMSRISILYYIDASASACKAINSRIDSRAIERVRSDLREGIEQIAEAAGCPSLPQQTDADHD